MRRDYLIDRLLDSIAQERALLRRVTRYILPLLLLPIGFALAQMVHGWIGLIAGGIGAAVLLTQIELFLRPTFDRARVTDGDITFYFGHRSTGGPPDLASAVQLLLPSALALGASMLLFLPTILANASKWQRLLALAVGLGALWMIWQRLAQVVVLLDRVEARLSAVRHPEVIQPITDQPRTENHPEGTRPKGQPRTTQRVPARRVNREPEQGTRNKEQRTKDREPTDNRQSAIYNLQSATDHGPRATDQHGLLDPALSQRVVGLPLPPLLLSPAAQALLRIEAYLLLRDFPDTTDHALRDALNGLAQQAHQDELRHWLLPPVGGKLYLPVAANGTLARLLGATARRFGMDGGYSASLGTWLVRLPPARSYAIAGRLIDALIALRLPPAGAILPHHLTIQGDLGQDSKILSLLHLAATPLVFAERPGHAVGDDRPFIMRGGGVLDDMAGRGRHSGPRTDFVDGFVFVQTPGMDRAEHLVTHTVNLRIKQVLAFGLLAGARPIDRRAAVEQRAAATYGRLRADLRALLANYGLAAALDIRWLDGRWSEVWPLIQRMSELKQHDADFLDAAQRLRDTALDEIERIAVAATRESRG